MDNNLKLLVNNNLKNVLDLGLESYFEKDRFQVYNQKERINLGLERIHYYLNRLRNEGYLEKYNNKLRPTIFSLDYYLDNNIPKIDIPENLRLKFKRQKERERERNRLIKLISNNLQVTTFLIDFEQMKVQGYKYLLNLGQEELREAISTLDIIENRREVILDLKQESRKKINNLYFYYRDTPSLNLKTIAIISFKTVLGVFNVIGKESIIGNIEIIKKIKTYKSILH